MYKLSLSADKRPGQLMDDRKQVEAIAMKLENCLIKNRNLADYNKALQDFEDRKIIWEVKAKEMEDWNDWSII